VFAGVDLWVTIGGTHISNISCDTEFSITVSKFWPAVAGEYHVEVKRDRIGC
jgi:hypothetical protein